MNNRFNSPVIALICLVSITPSAVWAQTVTSTSKTPVYSCSIDVAAGTSDCKGSVEILESSFGQIQAKTSLCSAVEGGKVSEVEFLARMSDKPVGWLLNIGDSATNNGYGGDWGKNSALDPWREGQESTGQSQDAELQVNGNLAGTQGGWSVWGNDSTQNALDGYRRLFAENNLNFANKTVRVLVKDRFAELQIMDSTAAPKQLVSPYLFALSGQADFQGPSNCDVYIGINRVIDGVYRSGSGVKKVDVNLYSAPTEIVSVGSDSLLNQLVMTPTRSLQALPQGVIASLSPASYAKIATQLYKRGVHPESVNIAMLGGSDQSRQMALETMRAQGLVSETSPTTSSIRKALRRFRRASLPRSPEMAAELLVAEKVGTVK